jgi:hypothetical protein
MSALRATSCCALLWCGVWLPAQQGGDEDRGRQDLSRMQRDLQSSRSELDRLIDLRRRHDLGLPPEEDPTAPRTPAPLSSEQRERLQTELREQESATASMLERWNRLRSMAEQLRAEVAERATMPRPEEPFAVVPPPGSPAPRLAAGGGTTPRPGSQPPGPEPTSAPEGSRPANAASPAAEPARLPPPRALIHGSSDHLRVGEALCLAGQDLVLRAEVARTAGQDEVARQLDHEAKERLQRALAELEPLLTAATPPLAALFFQGRCRELLFRHAERYDGLSLGRAPREFQQREQEVRDPFLAITARDVEKQGKRGEIEVLGTWGRAAQAAMEHFRWTNVHGTWQPKIPIESIQWSGEQGQ